MVEIATKKVTKEKRDQIIDAAIRLFLKKGIHQTSMRDIAESFGTSVANLYNYFNSKNEIITSAFNKPPQVFEALREQYKSLVNVSYTEAIRNTLKWIFLYTIENRNRTLLGTREFLTIYSLMGSKVLETEQQFILFYEHMLDEGVRAGEFKVNNSRMVAIIIWELIQESALRHWIWRDVASSEEYAEQQTDFIINSILVKNP